MRTAVFSTRAYDRLYLEAANKAAGHELAFYKESLGAATAALAAGFPAVCVFVNDRLDAAALALLARGGTRLLALRCAGYNNVDRHAAAAHNLTVVRVPAYSPHAVAEHTVALILALNRHLHRAYNRVREGNFALEGLIGFDLHGKTAGTVGTGQIGRLVGRILRGFGCRWLAADPQPHPEVTAAGGEYVPLPQLLAESDVISLHCPLLPETHHLINADAIARMKPGAMLINTSRGALVDTRAVIAGLKSRRIGSLGLDVYEEEEGVFFRDHSNEVMEDDTLARLLTFPNVIITGHQGFFTHEALTAIATTTLANITAFEQGRVSGNELPPP